MSESSNGGLVLLAAGENGLYCSGGSCPTSRVVLLAGGDMAIDTQGYEMQGLSGLAIVPDELIFDAAAEYAGVLQASGQRSRGGRASEVGGRVYPLADTGFVASGRVVTDQYRNVPAGETVVRVDPRQVVNAAARAGKLRNSKNVARLAGVGRGL